MKTSYLKNTTFGGTNQSMLTIGILGEFLDIRYIQNAHHFGIHYLPRKLLTKSILSLFMETRKKTSSLHDTISLLDNILYPCNNRNDLIISCHGLDVIDL